ncbi:MAG: hypothetical protein LUF28_09420 [Clostridiales bacterium]|nr:hypothetical protein [Clostridiales bacterium]
MRKIVTLFSARMERGKAQQRVARIIKELSSIDFAHSSLPAEDLERKTDPNQPCGDLEYTARYLQQLLRGAPQITQISTHSLDERLLTLARLFRQAVDQGDRYMAYAARSALTQGVRDIRVRIPQKNPELAQRFVELYSRHLENWIALVNSACEVDHLKRDVKNLSAIYDEETRQYHKSLENLKFIIYNDVEKVEAFQHFLEHDSPEDMGHWTKAQMDVYRLLVDHHLSRRQIDLTGRRLRDCLGRQSDEEEAVIAIWANLAALPVVADSNLLNKCSGEAQSMLDQLRKEQELDMLRRQAEEQEQSGSQQEEDTEAEGVQDGVLTQEAPASVTRDSLEALSVSELAADLFGEDS